MFSPMFNKVLVEIDDKDSTWGKSDDNIGGEVYREGTVLEIGYIIKTSEYDITPFDVEEYLFSLIGTQIMWHQGHEAGTMFEENGKKYCFIYWFDIIAVEKVEPRDLTSLKEEIGEAKTNMQSNRENIEKHRNLGFQI